MAREISATEQAALAAFIDADGCVGVVPRRGGREWAPVIEIEQKAKGPLHAFVDAFGGEIKLVKRGGRPSVWRWRVQGDQAWDVLFALRGNFGLKEPVTELLLTQRTDLYTHKTMSRMVTSLIYDRTDIA